MIQKQFNNARNGKIEIMRFVFAVLIFLHHINNQLNITMPKHFTFFAEGQMGVEFFFLVSGYLLAKNAKKYYENPQIVQNTKRFIYKKFLGIFPYHIIVFFICLPLALIFRTDHSFSKIFQRLLLSLPNFFFLQKSGIAEKELLTPEWYIAAMLIMMMVIYPLVLKFQDKFTKIAAPLLVIWLIGYMSHTDGMLGGTSLFLFGGVVPKAYVRAFAEICGGIVCFEVAEFLKKLKLTKADKIFLTALEVVCYLFPVCFSFINLSTAFEAYAFYSLLIAVTLSFSEVTLFNELFKNDIIYKLGRISLPLYYSQRVGFILINADFMQGIFIEYKILFCVAVTIAAIIAVDIIKTPFERLYSKKVSSLLEK